MPDGTPEAPATSPARSDRKKWPTLQVPVPPEWKVWLEEAAAARALPVAALVRQCIRQLMITRHDA